MSEFEHLIQQQREKVESSRQADTRREVQQASERRARERKLAHIIGIASVLAENIHQPADISLVLRRQEEVRKGFKKRLDWVDHPNYMSGWSIDQNISKYHTDAGLGAVRKISGIMLSTEGDVVGYRSKIEFQIGNPVTYVSEPVVVNGADVLSPNLSDNFHPDKGKYFIPDNPEGHVGHYQLSDIETGLAGLVVKYEVDPSLFTDI